MPDPTPEPVELLRDAAARVVALCDTPPSAPLVVDPSFAVALRTLQGALTEVSPGLRGPAAQARLTATGHALTELRTELAELKERADTNSKLLERLCARTEALGYGSIEDAMDAVPRARPAAPKPATRATIEAACHRLLTLEGVSEGAPDYLNACAQLQALLTEDPLERERTRALHDALDTFRAACRAGSRDPGSTYAADAGLELARTLARLLQRDGSRPLVNADWDTEGLRARAESSLGEITYSVCLKCGCTDERACPGGCAWADAERTLCTACVEQPAHLPTCGTAFEGCDPRCPLEQTQQELDDAGDWKGAMAARDLRDHTRKGQRVTGGGLDPADVTATAQRLLDDLGDRGWPRVVHLLRILEGAPFGEAVIVLSRSLVTLAHFASVARGESLDACLQLNRTLVERTPAELPDGLLEAVRS